MQIKNRQKPVRILQVLFHLARGGIETWLLNIARNIDPEKYQIDFLIHSHENAYYEEEIQQLGFNIYAAEEYSVLKHSSAIRKFLNNHPVKYQIIHVHMYLRSAFVLEQAYKYNIPHRILHIHPSEDIKAANWGRSIYRNIMTRKISKSTNVLLTNSKFSLQQFQSICDCSKMYRDVCYCGIDLSPFDKPVDREALRNQYNIPQDQPVCITVSRFAPHKNHRLILEFANRLEQENIQAQFVFAGTHGDMLPYLQEQSEKRKNLHLFIGLEDITPLLKSSDLFLFPSLNEGFGIAPVEAQAAGLPVLATNLPPVKEAVHPELHQYMIDPNDHETAYQNFKKFIVDEPFRSSFKDKVKEFVKQYSIQNSVKKLTKVYNHLIQNEKKSN